MIRVQMIGCVAAVLVGLLCSCARSPEARRDAFLAKGKELLDKGEYSRAVLEFKNAGKVKPQDAEPYYYVGMASLMSGDLRTAVLSFRKAVELNPQHTNAKLRLAQMMTAGDQALISEAEKSVKQIMRTEAVTPEMLNTLAIAELKLGKLDDAVESLEEALSKTPTELRSSMLLARAKLMQKDIKGTEEVLKKACGAAPDNGGPQIVLGRFYVSQNRTAEAEQAFQRALQLNPKSALALRDLAALQSITGRKQQAEENFKRLSGFSEETYKPAYAFFLIAEGRSGEAVREFERLAKEDPENRPARTRLVSAYQSAKRTEDARRVLDEALQKNSGDIDALLQRGQMLTAAGKYVEAEADFNKALRQRPDAAQLYYFTAKLHQARGTMLRYRQDLFKALELDPSLLMVRLELAGALINEKNAKTALDVLDQTPSSQKTSIPVIAQRNWALWASGSMQEMRKGIDQGLALARSTELLVQDGLWKLRMGNAPGARLVLEEALNVNPADIRALNGLKQAYVMQRQPAMAVQKTKEYAAKQPKSGPVQEFLGFIMWANGDHAAARTAFSAAKAANPQVHTADLALVQLDAMNAKWNDAVDRLKTIVSSDGGNVTARLWLGNIEVIKGNPGAALAHFQRVVEARPDNAQALNNLAYLLSEYANKPDEALKYAEKAKEIAPDNPEYADTLGWVFYRKGLYTSAIRQLERAGSSKGSPVADYHLAMAYAKTGDSVRGRAALERGLKRNPNLPEAKAAKELLGAAQ